MEFRGTEGGLGEFATAAGKGAYDTFELHAIDAWENEGGASGAEVGADKADVLRTALADIIGWLPYGNAGSQESGFEKDISSPDRQADPALAFADEGGLLRCLGAAVIMRWNSIPVKLQKTLFDDVRSTGILLHPKTKREERARLVCRRKNDTA